MDDLADVRIGNGVGMPGRPDAAWYTLGPDTHRLTRRVKELLTAFDASGADIAVLPEGALDPEILSMWKTTMREVRRPAGSPLRWVVLGSGPLPSADGVDWPMANAAVVLGRATGRTLLRHDKYAPFTFGVGQPQAWGLGDALTGPPPIHEAIRQGTHASAIESMIGRVGVLVCEDVTRHGEPAADAAVALGPSLILVPVFSKSLRRHFWEEQAGRRWSTLFGATVAICNSLVVAAVQRDPAPSPRVFGLLIEADDDPSSWPDPTAVHEASATAGTEVRVLPG